MAPNVTMVSDTLRPQLIALPSLMTVVGKTFTTPLLTPPGIVAGVAYADKDAMGTAFFFDVPKSGVILSASYYDLDDEALAIDLWLLRDAPTVQTDNAALTFGDGDIVKVIKRLSFLTATFGDAVDCQVSELDNIGRAYALPSRRMWGQVQARSAPTIAASNWPMFQLTILADE